jgi:hypothetical protein
MTETYFHRNNHFVSRGYLKRWALPDDRVWTYRILVSHAQVPLWKKSSIRGLAYHTHLYTGITADGETDEIEKWLDREFETPAEEAIERVTSGARLTAEDWKRLVRFLAAQDVRTPACLVERLKHWEATLPGLIEDTLQKSVRTLELARKSGQALPPPKISYADHMPFRVTTETKPGQKTGKLKGETLAGRGLWLFSIRHLLTQTVNVLIQHKWTILAPPDDINWFTSDDPVVRLNFNGPNKYDFGGGWGSPGTDIFLPLSPRHLLYTQVGKRPPSRGDTMARPQAEMVRRLVAEHAHRMIFAEKPDSAVPEFRPRTVDAHLFANENEQWRKWHEDQTIAEQELMGWLEPEASSISDAEKGDVG